MADQQLSLTTGGAGQRPDVPHDPAKAVLVPPPGLAPPVGSDSDADEYLVAMWQRCLGGRPGLCARRYQDALRKLEYARLKGDAERVHELTRTSNALAAVLDRDVRCRRCGRQLTNPKSVVNGIGPECAGKP